MRILSLGREIKLRDFVFEEKSDPTIFVEKELVFISIIAFDNDHDSILVINQVVEFQNNKTLLNNSRSTTSRTWPSGTSAFVAFHYKKEECYSR